MPQIEIAAELDCLAPAPIEIPLPAGLNVPVDNLELRAAQGDHRFPAQVQNGRLATLVSGLKAGQKLRLTLETAKQATPHVTLQEDGPHKLNLIVPEALFTSYNFDPEVARPFFYPVYAPSVPQKMVTRNYPMKQVAGEDHDHPHHRSFWTAYGEVNDVDDWSEEKNHGLIRHVKFEQRIEGPVFGGFTALNLWTDKDGKPLLDERRSIRVYNVGGDRRLLDYDVALIASYGDLHYGDTKEGGILSFRVATSMDGSKGGKMENSRGAVGEKDIWGKHAEWLDYSGPVDGETFGIGMMDHPGNLHYPCRWHARDYGLVGTNPFANAAFGEGDANGYTQKNGTTLQFRYRVLIHKGGAKNADMDGAYHAWVQAPTGRVVS